MQDHRIYFKDTSESFNGLFTSRISSKFIVAKPKMRETENTQRVMAASVQELQIHDLYLYLG